MSDTLEMVSHLSNEQLNALAAKFAAQPKAIKKAVRELQVEGDEATQYAVYILRKAANDYITSQLRDVWIQRLEMLIPRLLTKDEKLKTQTESSVAGIALEIEDVDQRGEIQVMLKKNLLPKSTDMYTLIKCFERLGEIFDSAWRS